MDFMPTAYSQEIPMQKVDIFDLFLSQLPKQIAGLNASRMQTEVSRLENKLQMLKRHLLRIEQEGENS